jgi:2-oxoglutarate dehydrogenase E2 component (dihydrolipoamide succinyltransferase)
VSQAPDNSSVEIRAPAEQTEGTRSQVLRWLKAVGDPVELNEPLIELETDKVTVEVAAPGSGVLQEILKGEAEAVDPGELLGRIGANGAATGSRAPASAPPSIAGSSAQSPLSRPPSPAADDDADGRGASNLMSPAVRRLLAEHSLDPSSIRGSGQGGRITVQDVLQAASGPAASARAEPVRRVPHSAVRKRIAEHMVRSLLHTAPHVTTVFEADLSAVLRHRAQHREACTKDGVPLTLTAYFLQAAVAAIRVVPEANSRWTDAALEIYENIHIAVATALEEDLVVPVLRHVDSLDLPATARALHELTTRARERRLTPADVRGGTFTISNHGVSGSLLAAPIVINQPQSAILGIGKLEKRVVVDDEDHFSVRPRCYVTLTIDHRVLDGQRANLFMRTFVERLESWPA